MLKNEFMNKIEELFELPQNTLNESSLLTNFSQWDSMTKLSLIVLISESFNKSVSSNVLNGFKYVSDILLFCGL